MKYLLRLSLLVFSVCSAPTFGQSVDVETQETLIQYRESDIGIDYRALAESPLAEMLSQGEAEFFENATPIFGDETEEAWQDMSAEIGTGAVSNYTVEGMREFTPNMLRKFALIGSQHPLYSYLSSEGALFVTEEIVTQ